ncbi:hypothetical protein DsansV1_C35g0228041 [Dioscorea sansibarensis]
MPVLPIQMVSWWNPKLLGLTSLPISTCHLLLYAGTKTSDWSGLNCQCGIVPHQ